MIAIGVVLDVASGDERKVIKKYLNSLSAKANCCAGFERYFTKKKLSPSKPIDVEVDVVLVTSSQGGAEVLREYVSGTHAVARVAAVAFGAGA
ncbi:MAG: hypothetical protein ACXWAC_16255 [Usitatibacter sp.]